jgi:hypothetical protein
VERQDVDEQPHKNAMVACSCEPDRFNVVAVHLAAILSTIAAAFKPCRAPARLPTSLACGLAISWRIERVSISPCRRRKINRPYGGSVPLDCDDPALAGNSDQDESPISPSVVWLALRRAELDCYAWCRTLIGRVDSAEDPDPQEHRKCHQLKYSELATWKANYLVGRRWFSRERTTDSHDDGDHKQNSTHTSSPLRESGTIENLTGDLKCSFRQRK